MGRIRFSFISSMPEDECSTQGRPGCYITPGRPRGPHPPHPHLAVTVITDLDHIKVEALEPLPQLPHLRESQRSRVHVGGHERTKPWHLIPNPNLTDPSAHLIASLLT